uniref:C-type lectin domain-containing protein n=1 Tax=Pygocentrus nattereri TaxID=42514 RepID=A0AAR2JVM6_PYGNA
GSKEQVSMAVCSMQFQCFTVHRARTHETKKRRLKKFDKLSLCLLTLSSCLSRQYYFVNVNKNWSEAQAICRQSYTDLATIENDNDQSSVIAAANGNFNSQIWIGQYEDLQNSWRWYLDDDTFYGNWLTGEPNNLGGTEHCTTVDVHLVPFKCIMLCWLSKYKI